MIASTREMRLASTLVLAAVCIPLLALTAAPVDFTGDYMSKPSKSKTDVPVSIHIVQTDTALEIVETACGKSSAGKYPLDGTDGVYTTETGFIGKGHARWKGTDLLIETLVASRLPTGLSMRFRTKERWQLVSGGKILKVHTEQDSPDISSDISGAVFQASTTLYDRVGRP